MRAGVGCFMKSTVPTFVFFEWSKIGRTWSSLRQRPHHMARVLAESGFQVLLVEPPAGDGADVVNPKPLADGVFFVTPRRNSPATLRPWLEQLSQQFSDAPWIVHHPAWTPFLRDFLLTSRIIAYDCMDEWGEFPGSPSKLSPWEANVSAWEVELAAKSHFVLATSISLWARMRLINRFTSYIPNAAYPKDFANQLPEARDLKAVSRPRLLFVGLVGEWVDLELIHYVAKTRPDWSLAMVGPSSVSSTALPQEPNIYWLGEKPYTELEAYMGHCEVGIIPFKQTKLTRAVNPLKAHEYLAAGLPVVSTFLPDLLLVADPAVQVTSSYDAFVKAVERALQQRLKPQTSGGTQAGAWEEKVAQFLDCLEGRGFERDMVIASRYAEAVAAILKEDFSPELAWDLAVVEYARGHYEAVLALTPPGSALRQAALVRMGRYDQVFAEIVGDQPRFRDNWPEEAVIAQVLLDNGEPAAALEALNKAASLGPEHHLVFGRVYASLGLFAESVAAFSQAVESLPSLLDATDFLTVGDVLRELGLDAEAEEYYVRAWALGQRTQGEERLSRLYFDRALSSARP